MIELYHSGTSVCAAKVRQALAEKDLQWQGHYLDILRGDQFVPEYLKLNPKGVVPTLVHDGTVIRESTVICEYLDDAFAAAPLRPLGASERAEMRLWTKSVDEELHPACTAMTFVATHRLTVLEKGSDNAERFIAGGASTAERERRRAWLFQGIDAPEVRQALAAYDKMLRRMEEALADRAWLAGDDFSLADVALTPYLNRLDMLSMAALWEDDRPHVADWFARIRARPSFEPAIFDHMPDAAREDMLTNGRVGGPQLMALLASVRSEETQPNGDA